MLTVYGAFPARPDLQQTFIDTLAKAHPSVTNWAIVKPSFDYAPTPHHESPYANYSKGQDRFAQFLTALKADDAKGMDVDKAIDNFSLTSRRWLIRLVALLLLPRQWQRLPPSNSHPNVNFYIIIGVQPPMGGCTAHWK